MRKVDAEVKLPQGYSIDWVGEYASQQRSQKRLEIVLPVTILLIFVILYAMFHSFKWSALMLVNMAMAPLGGNPKPASKSKPPALQFQHGRRYTAHRRGISRASRRTGQA